jgi:hypothetical protein
VVPLAPGRYEFKTFAEGNWVENAPCRVLLEGTSFNLLLETESVFNPYGTRNYGVWVK